MPLLHPPAIGTQGFLLWLLKGWRCEDTSTVEMKTVSEGGGKEENLTTSYKESVNNLMMLQIVKHIQT